MGLPLQLQHCEGQVARHQANRVMASERLAETITCHAWNKAKDRVAFCPNNNELHIYKYEGGKFTKEHVLVEHDQLISALDWAPQTNRIVTCSHDRNAYVWTLEGDKWSPVLVILRMSKGATFVRWSPKENKFAVGSGARQVSVCYYEEEHHWWVSKYFKKHTSTVLTLLAREQHAPCDRLCRWIRPRFCDGRQGLR